MHDVLDLDREFTHVARIDRAHLVAQIVEIVGHEGEIRHSIAHERSRGQQRGEEAVELEHSDELAVDIDHGEVRHAMREHLPCRIGDRVGVLQAFELAVEDHDGTHGGLSARRREAAGF